MFRSDGAAGAGAAYRGPLSQMLKFLLAGGAATAVQYLLLVIMIELLGIPEVPAAVTAYCLASLANYSLNYYFTFAGHESARHRQALPKFIVVVLCGLLLNTACFSVLLPYMHYLVAQVCATAVTVVFNFLLHKLWIYRAPE
ncbi:GtrA family protein [Microbulbifer aggregans]|uniref:GtrA family protein n=1 Tax=Microbulbifer aggregans TaxID=1769779 RepID=UPI001CFD0418|nr:GtrA family protein [Microbulbifer aggregans]